MAKYVDGFVLPVSKKNLKAYCALSRKCGKIWREHGALAFVECVGDDLAIPMGLPFPRLVKPKKGEVILFSFIIYKSRAHRDAVNKKAMNDPVMQKLCNVKMPFDMKRMAMGGFNSIVDA